MPPLDFDAPGATATDSTDQPGEAVAVADEAAPEANEAMPSLVDECEKEIEIANDSGHTTGIICDQSAAWVWAVHDGTAWRYGLKWEHPLGSRSTPSRLMPGEGYSDARNALLSGLGIARMDMLGKDADMIVKIDAAIDDLDAEGKTEAETIADEIKDELQSRIDAGESEDMTPIHIVNTPVEPRPRTPQPPLDDSASILRKIAEAESEVAEACTRISAIKDEMKDAKEDYEAAINRLRRLSRQIVADASRPLLAVAEANAKPVKVAEVNQGDLIVKDCTVSNGTETKAADECTVNSGTNWRDIRFDNADEFPTLGSLSVKLAEASIETVGQFADFQAKHGEFWTSEIKGVGKAKAEKISDAMIEFWSRHPEATATTTTGTTSSK